MEDLSNLRWLFELIIATVTSICGFFVGRKQQKNNFLSELQKSIDSLALINRKQMDEIIKLRGIVVEVRTDNHNLSKEIDILREENKVLTNEVKSLRQENSTLNEKVSLLTEQLSGVRTITKNKQ